MESLQETLDLSKNIYEMLPASGISIAFGLIISHLQAAHRVGIKSELVTGTATITFEDVPNTKTCHCGFFFQKTTSSSTTAVSITEYEPLVESTKLGRECYCGVQCTSKQHLEDHISQAHQMHDWVCCDKVS